MDMQRSNRELFSQNALWGFQMVMYQMEPQEPTL